MLGVICLPAIHREMEATPSASERGGVECADMRLEDTHLEGEVRRGLGIDGDGHIAAPGVIGLLHHLHLGAGDIVDGEGAADVEIYREAVGGGGVGPGGKLERELLRDIAHAAGAIVPPCNGHCRDRLHPAHWCSRNSCRSNRCPRGSRTVNGLFIEVGVLGILILQVQAVLEEELAAIGTRFTVGIVAQRVVGAEAFGGFAAADAAGQIKLFVDDVVPERLDGTLIIKVTRFFRDGSHAGISVGGADSVAHGFVLLDDGNLALVIRGSATAIVPKERFWLVATYLSPL